MAERIEELTDTGERPRVLVAGATGYTGALTARLVHEHPGLELVAVTGRSHTGERLDRIFPRHPVPLEVEELDNQTIERADAGIVAYPHGASAPVVAEMRGLGLVVVDLSADFRFLELPDYEKNYGAHGAPELLDGPDHVASLAERRRWLKQHHVREPFTPLGEPIDRVA